MKDYNYGARELTLIDAVSLIASGSPNIFVWETQLLDAFNNLPTVFHDAILVMAMCGPHPLGRYDWFGLLDEVTPENREVAMLAAIHERKVREKNEPPLWIVLVCVEVEKRGWTIREEWIAELQAAVMLCERGYFPDHFYPKLLDYAKEWLEKYEQGSCTN